MKQLTLPPTAKQLEKRMKHVARGRIILWEGASLWAFDAPAAAARRSTDVHAHHALQFTFSVGGSFRFRIGDEEIEGPTVLISPDVPHAYFPQGRNAMIFIEPESSLGTAVLRALAGRAYSSPDPVQFADIVSRFACIWEKPRPSDAILTRLGQELTARLAGSDLPVRALDARIACVLDRLTADGDTSLDLGKAADIACLSESRFSHLFVAEVGLPFRTYILWRRLMVAVNGVAVGATLTDAAHDAGFADSAHFSRTFLRMFGVPASFLLMI